MCTAVFKRCAVVILSLAVLIGCGGSSGPADPEVMPLKTGVIQDWASSVREKITEADVSNMEISSEDDVYAALKSILVEPLAEMGYSFDKTYAHYEEKGRSGSIVEIGAVSAFNSTVDMAVSMIQSQARSQGINIDRKSLFVNSGFCTEETWAKFHE